MDQSLEVYIMLLVKYFLMLNVFLVAIGCKHTVKEDASQVKATSAVNTLSDGTEVLILAEKSDRDSYCFYYSFADGISSSDDFQGFYDFVISHLSRSQGVVPLSPKNGRLIHSYIDQDSLDFAFKAGIKGEITLSKNVEANSSEEKSIEKRESKESLFYKRKKEVVKSAMSAATSLLILSGGISYFLDYEPAWLDKWMGWVPVISWITGGTGEKAVGGITGAVIGTYVPKPEEIEPDVSIKQNNALTGKKAKTIDEMIEEIISRDAPVKNDLSDTDFNQENFPLIDGMSDILEVADKRSSDNRKCPQPADIFNKYLDI